MNEIQDHDIIDRLRHSYDATSYVCAPTTDGFARRLQRRRTLIAAAAAIPMIGLGAAFVGSLDAPAQLGLVAGQGTLTSGPVTLEQETCPTPVDFSGFVDEQTAATYPTPEAAASSRGHVETDDVVVVREDPETTTTVHADVITADGQLRGTYELLKLEEGWTITGAHGCVF